jgi:hypothetical protein
MPALQINDRVRVRSSHWKCAGESGAVVAFDASKRNKYLVRFEREIVGTLNNRELWFGDQDLTQDA